MRKFYFWLNSPSIHQAPLINCLSANNKVYVIIESTISENRKSMGWEFPNFGNAKVFVSPSKNIRKNIIKTLTPDSIHLISGINAYPETYYSLKLLSKKKDLLLISMVESGRQNQGVKTYFRLLKHKFLALRWRNKIDIVLAIGNLGVDWWSRAGFNDDKIFEWGYFVDIPSKIRQHHPEQESDLFEIVVVASLIKLKNHSILLRALSSLDKYKLTIIGGGPEKDSLLKLGKFLNMSDKVIFTDQMSNDEVIKKLCKFDLLVLPSLFDGWGVVVNEALSVGTMVVCSNACGSSSLISNPLGGSVFKSNDVNSLNKILAQKINEGKISPRKRENIRRWSKNSISPKSATNYLDKILSSQCSKELIKPPWLLT